MIQYVRTYTGRRGFTLRPPILAVLGKQSSFLQVRLRAALVLLGLLRVNVQSPTPSCVPNLSRGREIIKERKRSCSSIP